MVEPGTRSTMVGYRWLLIETESDGVRVDQPPSLHEAWLDLRADGRLGWYDTVNYASGVYSRTRDGISVHGGIRTTLVGYAGLDSQQAAAMDAFNALMGCTNTGTAEALVICSVRDSKLDVHAGGHTLLFRRSGTIGPQP